ncbi:hypothetical protein FVEN_g13137 [Fusarium venenatum]|uniref:uncharacterized protein n=1 Tax=Fusarium venenatum TaxID=56646 RepID=UPI001DC890D5|nr:hypothetical protein FVEN_g13137 [Fusarium venenatum]KAH6980302.1 hypothetical protein EDB82DRAFT_528360 [Fusarium venenatum]
MMQQFLIFLSLSYYALSYPDFPNFAVADDPKVLAGAACATVSSVLMHCSTEVPANAPVEAAASCLCCDSTRNIDTAYAECARSLVTFTQLFDVASACNAAGDICPGGAAEATATTSDIITSETSAAIITSESNNRAASTKPGTTTEPTATTAMPTQTADQTAAAPSDKISMTYSMHAMGFILTFFLAYWILGA